MITVLLAPVVDAAETGRYPQRSPESERRLGNGTYKCWSPPSASALSA